MRLRLLSEIHEPLGSNYLNQIPVDSGWPVIFGGFQVVIAHVKIESELVLVCTVSFATFVSRFKDRVEAISDKKPIFCNKIIKRQFNFYSAHCFKHISQGISEILG